MPHGNSRDLSPLRSRASVLPCPSASRSCSLVVGDGGCSSEAEGPTSNPVFVNNETLPRSIFLRGCFGTRTHAAPLVHAPCVIIVAIASRGTFTDFGMDKMHHDLSMFLYLRCFTTCVLGHLNVAAKIFIDMTSVSRDTL